MGDDRDDSDEKPKPVIVRNTTDLQRLRLEKLMKNPDKVILIPERPRERGVPVVPDFVRNVMGSSAGAGSGEFHVYRHLRRKEYARQKYMKEKAEKEKLDEEHKAKLEDNKRKAEERTAKKRAKRLKKKQKAKNKSKKPKVEKSSESEDEDSHESNSEAEDGQSEAKIESAESDETIEKKTYLEDDVNNQSKKSCEAREICNKDTEESKESETKNINDIHNEEKYEDNAVDSTEIIDKVVEKEVNKMSTECKNDENCE